jgi:sugar/nucleoside kinase (ribokinase family)
MAIRPYAHRYVGFGYCPIDETFLSDGPVADTAAVGALGEPLVRAGGGSVANALCLLGELGHECHFFGVCGDDEGADFVEAELRAHKVIPHLMRQKGRRTPRCFCVVDPAGERNIFVDWRDGPADYPFDHFRRGRWWPLEHHDRNVTLTEFVHDAEVPGSAGFNFLYFLGQSFHRNTPERRENLFKILAGSEMAVASESFLRQWLGPSAGEPPDIDADTLRHVGMLWRWFVVTRGANGVSARNAEGVTMNLAAPRMTGPVVDTTGAGDAFLGALLHLFRHRSPASYPDTFANDLLAAQRVAGLCCRHWGARGYLSDIGGVRAALGMPGSAGA